MSRRALVTGGSGFVGGHLARRLVADGWAVTLTVRGSTTVPADLADLPVVRTDAGDDVLTAGVAAARPEVCFHLATSFVGVHTPEDVAPLLAANITFGTRLLEALSGTGAAVVNVGTVWQHHDGRPYGPTSLYAATKQAFAALLQFYAECTAVRAVTVELTDTYGPGDERGKLLAHLVRAARTGVPLQLSPGEQLVDPLHVDDVVEALLAAVPRASSQAPSYALTGSPLTVREFVDVVGAALGEPVPVVWGARPYRPREMTTPWRHYPLLPGWLPATPLRSGLAALFAGTQPPVV